MCKKIERGPYWTMILTSVNRLCIQFQLGREWQENQELKEPSSTTNSLQGQSGLHETLPQKTNHEGWTWSKCFTCMHKAVIKPSPVYNLYVLLSCVCVCSCMRFWIAHLCKCPQGTKAIRSTGTEVTGSYELLIWVLGTEPKSCKSRIQS